MLKDTRGGARKNAGRKKESDLTGQEALGVLHERMGPETTWGQVAAALQISKGILESWRFDGKVPTAPETAPGKRLQTLLDLCPDKLKDAARRPTAELEAEVCDCGMASTRYLNVHESKT